MTRAIAVLAWITGAVLLSAAGCARACDEACALPSPPPVREGASMEFPVKKSDAEWKTQLTPEQFDVTRKGKTERAFTGAYWNNHEPGLYRCVCCGEPLFDSRAKFDSGTGWPSFFKPVEPGNVGSERDLSYFMVRTEIHCARCGAHLGHLFEDGPQPTGLRYCVNSASLRFEPANKP